MLRGATYRTAASFEIAIHEIPKDEERPHGFHYRLAWVQVLGSGVNRLRVLFDNHKGKTDHIHLDGEESPYEFRGIDPLLDDFAEAIKKLGGPI